MKTPAFYSNHGYSDLHGGGGLVPAIRRTSHPTAQSEAIHRMRRTRRAERDNPAQCRSLCGVPPLKLGRSINSTSPRGKARAVPDAGIRGRQWMRHTSVAASIKSAAALATKLQKMQITQPAWKTASFKGEAICQTEHAALGWPVEDARIQYPRMPEGTRAA